MRLLNKSTLLLGLAVWVAACQPAPAEKNVPPALLALLDSVKARHAPDARVAWFKAEARYQGDSLLVLGETNLPAARTQLAQALAQQPTKAHLQMELLPSPALAGRLRAVVAVSVANLRSQPKHAAELATQALLGTPLHVWQKQGGWYLVQTPDRYLAWVDGGAITRLSQAGLDSFQQAPKVIYTGIYGHCYAQPQANAPIAADLVAGNVVETEGQQAGYVKLRFTDGRRAYVPAREVQPLPQWLATRNPTGANLVATARQMMGLPYLWGGTSVKGVDCSGFTKTAYFLNGLVIPRDASQQVHAGQAVDTAGRCAQLRPGDLLFFGRPATDSTTEKVVHVGLWLGERSFIHASNRVRVSSFDPQSPDYDDFESRRFLRARRLVTALPPNEQVYPVQRVFAQLP
jgi:gamma-D-glutamyl-L-lysine dipeptidyl-peptidase